MVFFLHIKNSLFVHKNGKSFSKMLLRKHDVTCGHINWISVAKDHSFHICHSCTSVQNTLTVTTYPCNN